MCNGGIKATSNGEHQNLESVLDLQENDVLYSGRNDKHFTSQNQLLQTLIGNANEILYNIRNDITIFQLFKRTFSTLVECVQLINYLVKYPYKARESVRLFLWY